MNAALIFFIICSGVCMLGLTIFMAVFTYKFLQD